MMPLVFTGIGAIAVLFGAVEAWRSWELASRGVETDGVVIRRVFAGVGDSDGSAPVVRFRLEGKSYEFQGKNSVTPDVGQAVRVAYLPERPSEAQIITF